VSRKSVWARPWGHVWRYFRFYASLVVAVAALYAVAANWHDVKEYIYSAWHFWSSRDFSLDVIVGSVLIILAVLLAVAAPAVCIYAVLARFPWLRTRARLAIHRGAQQTKLQLARVAKESRPPSLKRRDRRAWQRVLAAALEGLADERVFEAYCDGGDTSKPIVCCSFRAYAFAVSEVLRAFAQIRCPDGFPKVWTIFKKPVCDWYNTFRVEWEHDRKILHCHTTFDWWERYKDGVARLKGPGSHVQFFRLVAHIVRDGYPSDPLKYYLWWPEPLPLAEAWRKAGAFGNKVDWHPKVVELLSPGGASAPKSGADVPKVYLIGKARGGASPPEGSLKMVDHFQETYHDAGEPHEDQRGVYVRYLASRAELEVLRAGMLLTYDDLFIVMISPKCCFGLAFVADEFRDVNGVRFLRQFEISGQSGIKSLPPTLLPLLDAAWGSGKEEFVVCQ